MSAMNAEYFAALSISSLASDDRSVSIDDNGTYLSQSAIYQQLSNIEDIAANFVARKPISLSFKHSTYTEVEYDIHQDFEFSITNLNSHELIVLSIKCLPNFTVGEPVSLHNDKRLRPGFDHCALTFNLERKVVGRSVGEKIPFRASLLNGEYSILLSSSAKLTPGSYLLSVGLADIGCYSKEHSKAYADVHAIQAIRVKCLQTKTARTVPMEVGMPIIAKAALNEMVCYRFVTSDPRQMISITATPIKHEGSSSYCSDPDLYVTNRYNGQLAVTKENAVWSNTSLGTSCINILPDDANLPEDTKDGRVFVIGVTSSTAEEAEFSLLVTACLPPPCTVFDFSGQLRVSAALEQSSKPSNAFKKGDASHSCTVLDCAERGCTVEVPVSADTPSHFAVRLPDFDSCTSREGASSSIIMLLQEGPALSHAQIVQQANVAQLFHSEDISLSCGCGVYAGDTLAALGDLDHPFFSSSSGGVLKPVVYASADVSLPNRENYTWRASSANGTVVMVLNPAEWKYARPVCYLSIQGHPASNSSNSSSSSNKSGSGPTQAEMKVDKRIWRLSMWSAVPPSSLSQSQLLGLNVVTCIYENIDGNQLSLVDRKYDSSQQQSPHLRAQDDVSVTYFETEYVSMVSILQAAGAGNGQVFYDLGCGSGRALLSAALSGIRFIKCVGVEVLPSLAATAQQSVAWLTRCHYSGDTFRPLPPSPTRPPPNAPTGRSTSKHEEKDAQIKAQLDQLNVPLPTMEIWLDNILNVDWSDADFVYTASLCFSDQMIYQIISLGERLRPGARLVTLKLTENYHQYFVLEKTISISMIVGLCSAYVLRRIDSVVSE